VSRFGADIRITARPVWPDDEPLSTEFEE